MEKPSGNNVMQFEKHSQMQVWVSYYYYYFLFVLRAMYHVRAGVTENAILLYKPVIYFN